MSTDTKKEQHARFIETARKLECDEDEARFKEKLGKIAEAKIPESKPAK
jgi:hypothetical protein